MAHRYIKRFILYICQQSFARSLNPADFSMHCANRASSSDDSNNNIDSSTTTTTTTSTATFHASSSKTAFDKFGALLVLFLPSEGDDARQFLSLFSSVLLAIDQRERPNRSSRRTVFVCTWLFFYCPYIFRQRRKIVVKIPQRPVTTNFAAAKQFTM